MTGDEFLEFAIPFLQRMFPEFKRNWIINHHLWRARWSQPVVEKHYSSMIPAEESPYKRLYICSMAQIYPEDRGTNYAIRSGKNIVFKKLFK
jgi:predicted HD phosphohydrolase